MVYLNFNITEDIIRWSQVLFEGNVLSPASLNQMLDFDRHSIPGSASAGCGLGIKLFYLAEFNSAKAIGHGGEMLAYRMCMLYFPDEGMHFTIMFNEVNGECFWAVLEVLGDIIMNR